MSKTVTGNIFEELKKLRNASKNEDTVFTYEEPEETPETEDEEEVDLSQLPDEPVGPEDEEEYPESKKPASQKPLKEEDEEEELPEEPPMEEPIPEEPQEEVLSDEDVENILDSSDTFVSVADDGFIIPCPHCGEPVYLDETVEDIESIEDTETGEIYPPEEFVLEQPLESLRNRRKREAQATFRGKGTARRTAPRQTEAQAARAILRTSRSQKQTTVTEMVNILADDKVKKLVREGKMPIEAQRKYLKEHWGVDFPENK